MSGGGVRAALGWILLAQACGGVAPALTKLALAGLGPWSLVIVRQLLGTAFLGALLWARSRRTRGAPLPAPRPFTRRDQVLLLVVAWAGFALPQVLQALGLQLSTATHGALLIPLEPIGILLGGALLLGEPLTARRTLAVALGILGATLIVLPGAGDLARGDVRGDLLMALGHLSWAIYTIAAKPLLARHDALRISLLASALSPLPLVPLALTEPFDPQGALAAFGWILLLAFVATAVGTFTWNRALHLVRAGTMAAFVFVQPLVGLAIGVLALGEPAGPQALAGGACIAASVTLVALARDL